LVRLVDFQNNLIALARWVDEPAGGRWRLLHVFGN